MKMGLICSSGGHFFQLFSQKKVWQNQDHFWVSFPMEDTQCLLKDERVYWANYPTNRSIRNLLKNLGLAWWILRREKPDVVISTGAGIAVPFILVCKLFRIRTVYLESITRMQTLSMSGYLVYSFVDKLLVQWPELAQKYKKAEYRGRVI